MATKRKVEFAVGDRVGFAAAWGKNTQCHDAMRLRGTVAAIEDDKAFRGLPVQYVYVAWDGQSGWTDGDGNPKPGKLVCSANLARIGSARWSDAGTA